MNYPRISIVTPSYNQGQFIEQTILSILEQNYPNLEYIIIDGGSTDKTIEIIRKYEKHLSYWISEKDQGQSHAINKGLEQCTGTIFNWVNSDDYLEPGSLAFLAEEYLRQPFTAICGHVNVIDDTVFSHVRKPSSIGKTTADTIANFNINQEGTWWNLEAIKQLGGINQQFNYTMDLDLWIRALLEFDLESFRSTEKILSNFRRHGAAKSTIQSGYESSQNEFWKEQLHIFNCFIPSKANFSSYFELFELEKAQGDMSLRYNTCESTRLEITGSFLLKMLKHFFYTQQYKLAKNASIGLKRIEPSDFHKDIKFLRKKILLQSLKPWK